MTKILSLKFMCWTSAQKRKLSAIKNKDLKQKGENTSTINFIGVVHRTMAPRDGHILVCETCDYVALHRKEKKKPLKMWLN